MSGIRAGGSALGELLLRRKAAKLFELAAVGLVPVALIVTLGPLVGEDPLAFQGVVWVANVLMLLLIWVGLRLRGQSWEAFGLPLRRPRLAQLGRTVGISLIVLLAAVAAFAFGSVVGAGVFGVPEGADFAGYDYMRGNLPMLLLALAGAYIVSSLGEEMVYRGFLINRIAELLPERRRWPVGVLISGLLFGAAHYAWGPVGVVQTTFMGLALGAAYLRLGRNLWPLVLAHVYLDTLLFVQMYLGPA